MAVDSYFQGKSIQINFFYLREDLAMGQAMYRTIAACCMMIHLIFTSGGLLAGDLSDQVMVHQFDNIFEPSAVVSYSGNRVVVFEDEGREFISLHRIIQIKQGMVLQRIQDGFPELDISDIEGAVVAGETLYAITSHSTNKKGKRKKRREQLVAIDVSDDSRVVFQRNPGLREAIQTYLKKVYSMEDKAVEQLNIEGLSFDSKHGDFLIGLRAPTHMGKAVLVPLSNPEELSRKKYTPKFSDERLSLDLGGAGIRAISYDRESGTYYLANEVKSKKGKMKSRLWAWDGPGEKPYELTAKGLQRLKNIEGITVLTLKGIKMLLLVCDDGNRKKENGANYTLLEIDQLTREKK